MTDKTQFLTSVERSPGELRKEMDKYIATAESANMKDLALFLKDVKGEIAIREVENRYLYTEMRKMVDEMEMLRDDLKYARGGAC